MYSNPRAHRVGRLLALLIEPFILALAYAHSARFTYVADAVPLPGTLPHTLTFLPAFLSINSILRATSFIL